MKKAVIISPEFHVGFCINSLNSNGKIHMRWVGKRFSAETLCHSSVIFEYQGYFGMPGYELRKMRFAMDFPVLG